ncbi:MAG: type II secretion system protein [Pontiella sp.]
MNPKNINKNAFTLIEAITAITLFTMAMALAMSGFIFLLKNTNQENAQNELDIDVQQTMERLKHDIRLSSLDEIFYYADVEGKLQALSFPLGQDADNNGVLDKDTNGNILWGSQIIYHIKPTSPTELTRTIFSPRNIDLTDSQRQEQLEDVVATGNGNSTYNSEHVTSTMLFKNLLQWDILPTAGRYDAFADIADDTNIREEATLGYILISPGSHEFTFKVVDKNALSNGRAIGIDQLFISPSYGAREAERQTVTDYNGATPAPTYMPTGSWKGRYQLYFPAQNDGDSFTLTMNNDRWEESNFSIDFQAEDTEIIWDPTLSEYVVQLVGMEKTWDVVDQSGDSSGSETTHLTGMATVDILIRGKDQDPNLTINNPNWITYSGMRCKLTFRASPTSPLTLSDVRIGEGTSALQFSSGSTAVTFPTYTTTNNGSLQSDWIDLEIDKKKNYLVQFTATIASGNSLQKWTDNYTDTRSEAQFSNIANLTTNSSTTNIDYIPSLESIFSSYPTNGIYTSRVFDTRLDNPTYEYLTKESIEPTGTSISIKVKAGDTRDLSSVAWSSGTLEHSFDIFSQKGRYIQFQAVLNPDSTTATITPQLRNVTIEWTGEERLVNIGGIFTKGNDYGTFEVEVDGNPLRSALMVELEIYKKNVRGMNGEYRTITSALKVDLTPRNTGL